ncbi:CBASS cGAMP-activated phospholipase [Oceanivirga salmonicida]|uniref:CBASS cGAMP-activated phospholipase n=1 Tax=Oceanivirga salmonicida TaxID=1769291 RepID=UPI00083082B9|nr:CBASS cGAMP-activated phospholipase [Oceanivirga salmonicida]
MFKILCLDGGGARGYFSAYMLKKIEEEFDIKIHEYFDLIVGTSTGALISGGIGLGLELDEIVNLYKYEKHRIFQKKNFNIGVFSSIYTNENLKNLINEKYGNNSFENLKTNLIIASTDITDKKPKIFKSWKETKISLKEAVLCSSSAPTYFDPVKIGNKYYADGCFWANNPSILALSEALSEKSFNKNIEEIKILSIGTGRNMIKFDVTNTKNWGILTWVKDISKIMIDSSVYANDTMLNRILNNRYLRIDFELNEVMNMTDIPNSILYNADDIFENYREDIRKFLEFDNKKSLIKQEVKYNFIQRFVKKIFKI